MWLKIDYWNNNDNEWGYDAQSFFDEYWRVKPEDNVVENNTGDYWIVDSWVDSLKTMWKVIWWTASAIAQTPLNITRAFSKWMDYVTWNEDSIMTKSADSWKSWIEEAEKEYAWIDRETLLWQTTELIWWTFATSFLTPWKWAELIVKHWPEAMKYFRPFITWVEETIKYKAVWEWELTSSWEAWLWWAISTAIPVVWNVYKWWKWALWNMVNGLWLTITKTDDVLSNEIRNNADNIDKYISWKLSYEGMKKTISKHIPKSWEFMKKVDNLATEVKNTSDETYVFLNKNLKDRYETSKKILKDVWAEAENVNFHKTLIKWEWNVDSFLRDVESKLYKKFDVSIKKVMWPDWTVNKETIHNLSDSQKNAFFKSIDKIKNLRSYAGNKWELTTGDMIDMKRNVADIVDWEKWAGDRGNKLATEFSQDITSLTSGMADDYAKYAEKYSVIKKQFDDVFAPLADNKGEFKENMMNDLMTVDKPMFSDKLEKYAKILWIRKDVLLKQVRTVNSYSNIAWKPWEVIKDNINISKLWKMENSWNRSQKIETLLKEEKIEKTFKKFIEWKASKWEDDLMVEVFKEMQKPSKSLNDLYNLLWEKKTSELKALRAYVSLSKWWQWLASSLFEASAYSRFVAGWIIRDVVSTTLWGMAYNKEAVRKIMIKFNKTGGNKLKASVFDDFLEWRKEIDDPELPRELLARFINYYIANEEQ